MENKTAREIIEELKDRGFTYTRLAEICKDSVSTIGRVASGRYKDIDYAPGKRLEQLLKSRRKP